MLTLKRLGLYLFIFFITVTLLIVLVKFRRFDNYLVNEANKASNWNNELNKDIVLINLEKNKAGSEVNDDNHFRRNIINLLNTIAIEAKNNKGPKGVLLDLYFSSDSTYITQLKTALKQLKDLKVPVYASYNINEKHERLEINNIDFDAVEANHATDIYSNYLKGSEEINAGAGRYHTFFYPDKDVANYENDIYLFSSLGEDSVLIGSLVQKVGMDLNSSGSISHISKRVGSLVPYRSPSMMEKATYTFIPGQNESPGIFKPGAAHKVAVDMNKNIMVVGDMANDRVNIDNKRQIPGTYIVTWALSNLLDSNTGLKLPIESLYLIIGQILFFSFISVLIYALLFKYVKRLQTKPAVIAFISFAVTALIFFSYFRVVFSFNYVIPASHTIVATCVACILSYRFAHKFLVTGVAEGSQKYDVFISYSRSQSDWVDKYVYAPLAAYTKPNGEKLKIFYDKKSIGIGEMFTTKYMWAIVDTKYFIPIFSDDYYLKNHCRNEMDCAVKREIEKLLSIQAIALSFKAVPEAFNCINFIDVTKTPGFIQVIEAELSKQFAVAPSRSLIIEDKQEAILQVNMGLTNGETMLKEVSSLQSKKGLIKKEFETLSEKESGIQATLMVLKKQPVVLSKDAFILKHYCLEKAIEVYKCNQSTTVVELAEQFERYLKSSQAEDTGNACLPLT